ncbi:MAG: dTDP-4-amino-4,6-dideoxygalactose transaminase [Bacteroidales bacterium]|nr:dTDP-4-amino-4,6-dideoxygalactose transaminase [Bacteroidales bacterium]
MLPFNKPYLTGKETDYIKQAVASGHISGNGEFTKKCHHFFENKYNFGKCLLTTSCTDALEMAAMLIDIKPGDEVIMPSFTYVSTALAFIRQGARIVFIDSRQDNPNIDESQIEKNITPRTKAIICVHYGGVACNMDVISGLVKKYKLWLIEDAANAIHSFYKGKPLGSFGHLACFSFHETKNIQCGEGGMLVINHKPFEKRAEIIWEKGTNRAAFWRGEIDKYSWVDTGSSFLPSDILAAFLFAQLENIDDIQAKRTKIWQEYYKNLKMLEIRGVFKMPVIPDYATNNSHIFYLQCMNEQIRSELISYLKEHNIYSVFHYQSLHKSPYYKDKYSGGSLSMSDKFADTLVRLPMYYELSITDVGFICKTIENFIVNSVLKIN